MNKLHHGTYRKWECAKQTYSSCVVMVFKLAGLSVCKVYSRASPSSVNSSARSATVNTEASECFMGAEL